MKILVCLVLFLLILHSISESGIAAPQREQTGNDEDPRLLALKRRKLKRLCSLLGLSSKEADAEARTLIFLQVQQLQQGYPGGGGGGHEGGGGGGGGGGGNEGGGGGGHEGGGGGGTHSGGNICDILGGQGGGGGGGGGLLGGLGGLLGGSQSDVVPNANPIGIFSDLDSIRPQRYLRPIYRTFRPFLNFFKK